ncbi:Protein kinase-like domain protein [Metarhizium guizhouense ARSEF 977]|uniref:non-specific serine/threonine protein kinase n=1 Tax=Metarhizium guizhouense (strain ARSEF 977) TaxID=1276136 RepID=A0A0B4GQA7_METGA|nr:Protein kinase-like domain protein [Metarhizium guizhouense ARSEF 977]
MPPQVGERPKPVGGSPIRRYPQHPSRLWKRLYYAGWQDDHFLFEKLIYYQPKGLHPIDLGDELHDHRFRVIHKLGHGGSSTVWLCRDQSKDRPVYVAVKVFQAGFTETECRELLMFKVKDEGIDDQEHYLCLPKERFISKSPNGTHLCLVFPVLGPTVDQAASIFEEEQNSSSILRTISRSIIEALATLHRRGICHAGMVREYTPIAFQLTESWPDFRPANILLGLQSLDGLPEEQVLAQLGEPEGEIIQIREDSLPTPEIPYAPKYLIYPVDFYDTSPSFILPRAVVIDFGQAVEAAGEKAPPGIPANYAAPEVIRQGCGGQEMDLWSLACTLFEVRVGQQLFNVPQLIGVDERDYEDEISSVLGKPGHGRSDRDMAREIGKRAFGKDMTPEKEQWAEMLAGLLRYEPDERPKAQDLLNNAWFGQG